MIESHCISSQQHFHFPVCDFSSLFPERIEADKRDVFQTSPIPAWVYFWFG